MGRQNIIVQEEKPPHPLIPLFGFIIILIIGGLSYMISPRVVHWLKNTHFTLGGLIPVLPIEFPAGWPALAHNLAVTAVLFFGIFTIGTMMIFFVAKPPGKKEVDLDMIRKEAQQKRKRR
ncbi:MAG: hypothetical protein JXB07_11620 [Anaerolineae bacterium]|nr:hypothetical protein [Anaerolineae bacterium]